MGCTWSTQHANEATKLSDVLRNCAETYSHCEYIIALKQILKLYNDWQSSIKQETSDVKTNNYTILTYIDNYMTSYNENDKIKPYSIVSILELYHHLIDHHMADFEAIYNYFRDDEKYNCSMESCNMISRNHRDRGREENGRTQRECYAQSSDAQEVILQQILDQIHCYILHTFDMGFALTKQEKEGILQEEKEPEQQRGRQQERIARVIHNKKREIRELRNRIGHGVSLDESNKFMSNIDPNENTQQDAMFSFGVGYYYDAKHRDNDALDGTGHTYSHWFVPKKHKDLKSELLSNKTEHINHVQYQDLHCKSQEYLKTEHVRLNCKQIHGSHLMCIMLYCNFDTFQAAFSKTYRHDTNEDDESLKKRHSEFANFGEMLQKAVDLNGIMVDKGKIRHFYHGINAELMFTSTLNKFSGPISTSSEYSVAMVFTQENGIILELQDGTLYADEENSVYFDCEWISDFGYEKEKLFVSTKEPLKIVSIFHVRLGQNYGEYIKLITILLSIIKANVSLNDKKELNERNMRAIVKLLKHESKEAVIEDMPQYITNLLHHICLNILVFSSRYNSSFSKRNNQYYSKYRCLAEFWCCDEYELFDLDVLCSIFPNLNSISITRSLLTDKVFDDILQFLCGENKAKMTNFVFQSPVNRLSNSFIKKYEEKFEEIGWSIGLEKGNRLVIKHKKYCLDRAASTNVLNTQRTLDKTEAFELQKSLYGFYDDE